MLFRPGPLTIGLFLLLVGAIAATASFLVLRLRNVRTIEYTLSFVERFRVLVESMRCGSLDSKALGWLDQRAETMQSLMGSHGMVEYWSPEGNYIEREFRIVERTLQEAKRGRLSEHLASSCQLALLRFLNQLDARYR